MTGAAARILVLDFVRTRFGSAVPHINAAPPTIAVGFPRDDFEPERDRPYRASSEKSDAKLPQNDSGHKCDEFYRPWFAEVLETCILILWVTFISRLTKRKNL